MRYRSATVFGKPTLVSSEEEKVHGMRVISEHLMPGRWDELREPLENEVKMTGVIALEIESASAKTSSGIPEDEEEDYDTPIWAGVLPLHSAFTTLQDDGRVLADVEPSAAIRGLQGKLL